MESERALSLLLQLFLIAVSVLFFLYVITMLRRNQNLLSYSIVWLLLSILGVVGAIFPGLVSDVSRALGFLTPSNFVFFVCMLFCISSSLIFVTALSKHANTITQLVQELSILKAELNGTVPAERDSPRGMDQDENRPRQ